MQDVLVISSFVVVLILLFVCSNKRASAEEQTINKLLSQPRTKTTNHKLKFKCKCGNEFTADKKECKCKSFMNVACIGMIDDYYYKNCPICGKRCCKIL